MRWQIGITWTCGACTYNHDLSTGVANWTVNGHPAYPTAPFSGWAIKDPSLAALLTGTKWIQPVNAPTPQSQPSGLYIYRSDFTVPACATLDANKQVKVQGWFAADNGASLKIDGSVVAACSLYPFCFLQKNMVSFSKMVIGGPHILEIDVKNEGSVTGLVAHITMP
jgi:hypothetical protein